MGQEIKIVDLVQKMVRLRGLRLGRDIDIVYTGVRSGEKLSEEICSAGEEKLPTPHQRIFRLSRNSHPDWQSLLQEIDGLLVLAQEGREKELATALLRIARTSGLKADAKRGGIEK